MIKNMWYGILESKELKGKQAIGVTRLNEKLVLWRQSNGSIGCIADKCCHRGAALSGGWLKEDELICPFHGFAYDTSGKVILIPANGKAAPVSERYKVHAYQAVEKYGFIWVWTGDYKDTAPEIPFFEELREGFSYGGFGEVWDVHYTRAIENQLDVVHLPYVHTDSIGRGNRTIVNGPVVEWENDRMTFYVNNVTDDGKSVAKKASEIEDYKSLFSLQLQMPNTWQNRISDQVRIVAVFAPIDETHTKIYVRFYQKFMKIPGLKQLVNLMSTPANKHVFHQDRKVVNTQIPVKSEFVMGENLIPGDAPILQYRKKRAQLKGEIPVRE
ncbi:MAG: aromatic ring-hydroxylating dioxygenase subunit alpha [Erysipelotrichaceae bacterium]|jgi:phenylpropionate dioxygenase-like ring-hydroxylating dioxygenase large terminal subunit|nr:aromatic ring-hydroxylating dioxygenase subunit alpha [Erysipelotrichaceae bacterium]